MSAGVLSMCSILAYYHSTACSTMEFTGMALEVTMADTSDSWRTHVCIGQFRSTESTLKDYF